MTAARRVLIGIACAVTVVVVLVAGTLAWALSSESGAKKVIAIALGRSPSGLEIGEIRGRLRGPLILTHIKYRSGALSAEVDSAWIEWRASHLLLGRVEFQELHVTGMRVILPDSTPRDTAGTARVRRLRPVVPLPVTLGDVFVTGLEVDAPGGVALRDGMVTMGGKLEDYRFAMTADASAPYAGAIEAHLTGKGNLEEIQLDSSSARLLGGKLVMTGMVGWWPGFKWDLALVSDSLRPGLLTPRFAGWPGRVAFHATTTGGMDSSGLLGRAQLDSISGRLRGQPLSGHFSVGFAPEGFNLSAFDVHWGSARLIAQGTMYDSVAMRYDLAVADLRTVLPRTRGSLLLNGTASGPSRSARLRARFEARNLVSGPERLAHASGSADIDLASGGRNDLELRGQRGGLGPLAFDTVIASLRGTHRSHRLSVAATGPVDSLRLGLAGGLVARIWRGRVATLALHTARLGGWGLERPAALTASLRTRSAQLGTLCLTADSAAGRLCAEGGWRSSRSWNVLATLSDLPARRLALPAISEQGRVAGTVGARLDLRAVSGRLDGTMRAATDTVALVWRKGTDKAEHRLTLDSAVVDLKADAKGGIVTTVGVRLSDERRKELATLAGNLVLSDYRVGAGLLRQPIRYAVDGQVADLGFLQPFVFGLDSLKGAVTLSVSGSGTLAAPEFTGNAGLTRFVAGFPGRRAASGTLALTAKGALGPGRALNADARLDASGFGYDFWYYSERRRLTVDTGSVVLTGDAAGLRAKLGFGVKDLKGAGIATLTGDLTLPEYTRLGMPLAPQPLQLTLASKIPDLAVLQPLMMSVDSLAGVLTLDVAATGRLGAPSGHATLRLDSAKGRLPSGTMAQGGLGADLELKVAADNSFTGSFKVEPHDATFRYPVGGGTRLMRLDHSALELLAAGDGVRGTLDVTFADSGGAAMGTLKGRTAMPGLTHIDERLGRQPVQATLEGRVSDFAFLETFTAQVDSAAGKVNLDAKLDGILSDAQLVGGVELKDVAIRMPLLGILLEDIQLTGRGDRVGSISVNGTMRSGGGDLTLTGTTPVQPSGAQPGHLHLKANRFEAMNNAELHAVLTGDVDVRIAEDSLDIRGDLKVPLARLVLTEIPVSAVAPSDDVILLDSILVSRRNRPLKADLKIALGDSVSFSGFNFNAELGGSLHLVQQSDRLPTGAGVLYIEEGHYRAYGQDLTIRRGEVRFSGGPIDNPALAISATRDAFNGTQRVLAGLRITGTVKAPEVALFSEPPMAETQILSYILTGGAVGAGMGGSLWDKALTTLGLRGGDALSGAMNQQVGLNQARLSTTGDLRGTALVLGKFLTPSLYVGYGIGVFDPIGTLRLRYVLSNHFTLLAEAGRVSSADALVKVEGGKSKTP